MLDTVTSSIPLSHITHLMTHENTLSHTDSQAWHPLTHMVSRSPTYHMDAQRHSYTANGETQEAPRFAPQTILAVTRSCFHSQICSYCTLPHKHTLLSLCIEDHPRLDIGTNLSPFVCVSCWPGFLRAFPQGQGGEPSWRWVCTPSWLTHLSHWEWLTLGDPEFTVGTGANPGAPWSHPAMGGRHRVSPGEWVRRVFAQWATIVPGTPELWAGIWPSLAQLWA